MFEEIQKSIDDGIEFYQLIDILPVLSKQYSLDRLSLYYNCKRADKDDVVYFDLDTEVDFTINGEVCSLDEVKIQDDDNFKFVPLNIGKSLAPKWVQEKIKECIIEVEMSEKAKRAYTYYEHRDQFIIVDSIKVNGINVTGILDRGDYELYFTADFDYDSFISEYQDCYTYEYQSSDDCYSEMEEDFDAIISAYKGEISVDFDYKLHNVIKNIMQEQNVSPNDISKMELVKDEYGNWKLCVLSGDKKLGEFFTKGVHNF